MPHSPPAGWHLPEAPTPDATRVDGALVWLRRDLRLDDHTALQFALRSARRVWCLFVFDSDILDPLPRNDRRVGFLYDTLVALDAALQARGAALIVRHGRPQTAVREVATGLGVQHVYCNRDYEPSALVRDHAVHRALAAEGIALFGSKDQVIFDRDELLTGQRSPYTVFTPYKRAWLQRLSGDDLAPRSTQPFLDALAPVPAGVARRMPSLADLGFQPVALAATLQANARSERLEDFLVRIDDYADKRDYPALKGPSYLGIDLRFGTLSVRDLVKRAHDRWIGGSRGAETWLSELVWREFYMQVLHHFPHVATRAFRPAYDAVAWEQGPEADARFDAWCEGRTGYPLVDAAMRQLAQTGYMHNRLRMVTASFLTKDLGVDWRRGEAWFAQQLNDFELASNNGGWQWSASTGCDAQPYFRIFNPVSQSQKFDPQGRFILRYVPELAGLPPAALHAPWTARPIDLNAAGLALGRDYPTPVVDHAEARTKTLARYAVARG